MIPDVADVELTLGDGRILHAVSAGLGIPILLIHGADRKFQNAGHWQPHLGWLAACGHVLAVDLLGHGGSRPGENDSLDAPVPVGEQVAALAALLERHGGGGGACVAVGRSYGARVALELAAAYPQRVRGLVLIAPAVPPPDLERLPEAVRALPTLLVWARDDPVVPASNRPAVQQAFSRAEFLDMGEINPPESARWRAHTPELEKPELFQHRVSTFLRGLH